MSLVSNQCSEAICVLVSMFQPVLCPHPDAFFVLDGAFIVLNLSLVEGGTFLTDLWTDTKSNPVSRDAYIFSHGLSFGRTKL